MSISISFLLQLLVCFIIGGGVAYRSKKMLLAILLRVMPMRYKISENASYLQARISTLLILSIIFSVAGLSYYGINKAKQALTPMLSSHQTVTSIRKSVYKPLLPPPSKVSIRDTSHLEAIPISYADYETPAPRLERPSVSPTPSVRYFLQIAAFRSRQKANKKRVMENRKGKVQCLVGVIDADGIPYKILLGPFTSFQKVKTYQRQNNLSGYPKSADQIDYFLHQ
jgi:hypothetical protein